MKTLVTALVAALLLTALTACGGTRFMGPATAVEAPPAGKALVNFHRPSNYGGGADFPIYDRTRLVGNLEGKSMFQYIAEPGEHLFIGRADKVSVVKAQLAADKVYDIAVDVGMGMMQANVHLAALGKGDERRAKLADWQAKERVIGLSDQAEADRFAERKRKDIEKIIADFEGPKKDRVQLLAADDCR